MDQYANGTDITLTVGHVYNGALLPLTDLLFQVLDSTGTILVDFASASEFDTVNTSTDITIDRSLNNSINKYDIRQVNIQLVSSTGIYVQTIYYQLVGDLTKLTPMVDSFMTYAESLAIRFKMNNDIRYFDALEDSEKAVALTNSFSSLVKLLYDFQTYSNSSNYENSLFYGSYGSQNDWCAPTRGTDITEYTLEQFKLLPTKFQEAIKRAQLVQANALVEANPVLDKVRSGIISETIGESSMFFKQDVTKIGITKYPNLADDAYEYIKSWLFVNATKSHSIRIART